MMIQENQIWRAKVEKIVVGKENEMSLIHVLECRWCGKKIIPNLETGVYAKKCPNSKCRRQTWKLTNREILANKLKSINALLDNHKHGKIGRKKSYRKDVIKNLMEEKEKEVLKMMVCKKCESVFTDIIALKRHQIRRNHVD